MLCFLEDMVENHAKGKKLHICFMDLENTFDRLPR